MPRMSRPTDRVATASYNRKTSRALREVDIASVFRILGKTPFPEHKTMVQKSLGSTFAARRKIHIRVNKE